MTCRTYQAPFSVGGSGFGAGVIHDALGKILSPADVVSFLNAAAESPAANQDWVNESLNMRVSALERRIGR